MKTLLKFFLLGFLTLGGLVSCSSDDDAATISASASDIVGTWNLTDFRSMTSSTVTVQGQTLTSSSSVVGNEFDLTIEFSENPNIVTSEGSYRINFTTNVLGQETSGSQVIELEDFDESILRGTWGISEDGQFLENSNTVNGEEVTVRARILELTANRFVYAIDLSEVDQDSLIQTDGLPVGAEVTFSGTQTVTLTR